MSRKQKEASVAGYRIKNMGGLGCVVIDDDDAEVFGPVAEAVAKAWIVERKNPPRPAAVGEGEANDLDEPSHLAAFAATASSSGDHTRVAGALRRQLGKVEARLEALEAGREQAALSGRIDENSREIWEVTQRITSLRIAIKGAELRHDEAQTREIADEMIASAAKAREKVPDLAEAWRRFYRALIEVKAAVDAVEVATTDIKDLQAAATRANRRDLLVNFAAVRQEVAAELPVIAFGADSRRQVLREDDNIKRAALVAVDVANYLGVHNRDPFLAARNNVLVNVREKTATGAVAETAGSNSFGKLG